MGLATSEAIAEKLIADGLAPEIPVAVIENATRPQMRVLRSSLAGLPALVTAHQIKSPAIIVIGEAAGVTETKNLRALALEGMQ
jgi:uroporphyrin-III C-methyltransferase